MSSLTDIKTKKLCFAWCGERCNCEIGMDWPLSSDALSAQLAEIEKHIVVGGPNVFFPVKSVLASGWLVGGLLDKASRLN